MIFITDQNAFYLRITAQTKAGSQMADVDLSVIKWLVAQFVRRGRSLQSMEIDSQGRAVIFNSGDLAMGVYGVEFNGYYNGQPWRFFEKKVFAIVDQTVNAVEQSGEINGIPVFDVTLTITLGGEGVPESYVTNAINEHDNDMNAHPYLQELIENAGEVDDVKVNGLSVVNENKEANINITATIDGNIGVPEVDVEQEDGKIRFAFKNMKGEKGETGAEGKQGPQGDSFQPIEDVSGLVLAHTTGQDNTKAMSQKGVTDEMYKRLDKGSDDSENILNVTDESGNILACFNKDGEMLFKRVKKLDARWQDLSPTNAATDFKGCFYNNEGVLKSLGVNSAAAYYGTAKIDVTEYRGKTLYILTSTSGNAYNMFKAIDGSIIEEWQQSSVVAKVVPDDAEFLLLSNLFYDTSMTPVVAEPYVYYNDALQLLIEQKENDGQYDKSGNILNIVDENGKILAYFDEQGVLRAKYPDNLAGEFEINLPPTMNSYVGDTLQLFKYPITMLGDYANYGVNLSIRTSDNNVRANGKNLRRYFEFTPPSVGIYTIDANVMDTRQLKLLAEKVLTINVLTPTNPQNVVNVLCIGDSETEGVVNNSNYTAADGSTKSTKSPYTNELKARLTTSRTATSTLPVGLGLSNIHLIGTRNISGGRHEGYGGWGVDEFLKSGSPFWKNGAVDYNAYLAQDSVYDDTENKGVDIMYILLGGNHPTPFNPEDGSLDTSDYEGKIKTMLNGINSQLRTDENADFYNPNLKVVLLNYWAPYIEGRGYHPYGSTRYVDNCCTAKIFMEYYKTNCRVAALDDYADWVDSVMLAPAIDSENGFVYMNKQKNVYMSDTEPNALEAVHPNSIAYKMIGAAVMRDLIGRI